ncbi:hypothetical protein J1C54_02310 [Alcanivorax sp. 1008]|nr:hypothetical protein [Alcanivorax sp. 1008]
MITMRLLTLLLCTICSASLAQTDDCRAWLDQQQRALDERGIVDAGSMRIDGHPHLRANRWLAFLHQQAVGDASQQLWLEMAANEALQGWHAELSRLYGHQQWRDQLESCIHKLTGLSGFYGVPEPQIPDSYASWQRVVGLYPVAKIVAAPSIKRYRRDMNQRFQRPARLPIRHYLPESFRGNLPVPRDLAPNGFDLPLPKGATGNALFSHYAPVLSIADPKDVNQPGQVFLDNGQPGVDITKPTVYQWFSWTRYRGHKLLQLNYQFWFSRRPAAGLLNLYGGELDSLIWRVTLKPDGNVLYYDSIHGCGCYHKVFTVARGLYPDNSLSDPPLFYPHPVANAGKERISLLLEADTHYLVRVSAYSAEGEQQYYQQHNANVLRALPDRRGGYGSLFDQRGLVAASKRRERFLLWPLGIPSAGAMRQPGQHATAFIGRRHFDDPTLPETLFGK